MEKPIAIVKLGRIGAAAVAVVLVIVVAVAWTKTESNATPAQVEAIRQYIQLHEGVRGFEQIQELGGDAKKKALMAQAARIKELEVLKLESAGVRGLGMDRVAKAEFRLPPNGSLERRYFRLGYDPVLGKWAVTGGALESQYVLKIW